MQKLTRRQALKWGIAGGASLALPLGVLQAPLARIRASEATSSPATHAFQVPLPIPPVLAPIHRDDEADYYEITQKPGVAHLLPGLITPLWGYNGIFPGPTIEARRGRKVVIRQHNELHVPVSTHLHGGHTPPSSDGHPIDLLLPKDASPFQASLTNGQMRQFMSKEGLGSSLQMRMQTTKEYVYPNTQRATTLWYHDHRMDFTGPQVYQELAGFYLIRDEIEEAEIWEFTSDGNHPIHLHLVNFQVLSRDGRKPDPEDTGYKDTIFLKAGEKARVITRFEDYRGLYVFHCHNAEHSGFSVARCLASDAIEKEKGRRSSINRKKEAKHEKAIVSCLAQSTSFCWRMSGPGLFGKLSGRCLEGAALV